MAARAATVLAASGLFLGAEATLPTITLQTGTWIQKTNADTVAGTVVLSQVTADEAKHHIKADLTGLGTNCDGSNCAIKIQKGTCAKTLSGAANPEGATGAFLIGNIGTGATFEFNDEKESLSTKMDKLKTGHMIVVENKDDEFRACAPLAVFEGSTDSKATETTLAKIGDATVKGSAKVTFNKGKAVVQLALTEGDKDNCGIGHSATDPKCSVIVSSATSCEAKTDDQKTKLKALYKSGLKAKYQVDSNKKVKMSSQILTATEAELKAVIGQTVVVLDKDGNAAACGVISDKDTSTAGGASHVAAGPLAALLALVAAFRA